MNDNLNVPECASQNAKIRAWLLDGKEIPIKDMTDEHLMNAIRRFEKIDDMLNGYDADNL